MVAFAKLLSVVYLTLPTMHPLKTAVISALALAAIPSLVSAQTITTFDGDTGTDDAWTFNSSTNRLSGIEGLGYLLYGSTASTDFTGITSITLTANVVAGFAPVNGFTFLLLDGEEDTATATFDWSEFVGGTSVTAVLMDVSPSFNFGNVIAWNLVSGSSNTNLDVNLISAVGTAVPEPSTFAILAGMSAMFIVSSHRRRA